MKNKTKHKYTTGDKVKTYFTDDEVVIVKKPPHWNGLTWMYSFENTDMRCGEAYLYKIQHHETKNG